MLGKRGVYELFGTICGVVAEVLQPVHFGIAAEPGELALGVVAVSLLGSGDGLGERALAAQMAGGLAVAERAHGEDLGAVDGKQSPGLLDQSLLEHAGASRIDAIVKGGARGAEAEAQDAVALEGVTAMEQKLAHGAGGGGADLDGADQLGLIVGMDAEGGFGVEAAQQTPERSGTAAVAQPLAKVLVALRAGEEA